MSDAVFETLKCAICLDYADSAVETECCQQIYCQKCLDSLEKRICPSCQTENFAQTVNIVVRRMIANIPVKCPNNCTETTTRGEVEKHLLNCSLNVFQCPVKNCEFSDLRTEIIEHMTKEHQKFMIECTVKVSNEEKSKCPFPKCTMNMLPINLHQHFQNTHVDDLKNVGKTACPKCKQFLNEVHFIQHMKESHLDLLVDEINCLCYISKENPTRMKNTSGRNVTMARNGKYYCGQLNSVHAGNVKIKPCESASGINCIDCMELDVIPRNLPRGELVNKEGRVSIPRPCEHYDKNGGSFHDPGRAPVMCRTYTCGSKPTYQCFRDMYSGHYKRCSFNDQCPECCVIANVMNFGAYDAIWPPTKLVFTKKE